MRRAWAVAAVLAGVACTKPVRPPAPDAGGGAAAPGAAPSRDAGVPRQGAAALSEGEFTRPPAAFSLAWIAEVDGVPQLVVDGAFLTSGPAHYLSAPVPGGLLVTRSEREVEQLLRLSLDGGAVSVGAPSARAKNATAAAGAVLFESGAGGGLAALVDGAGRAVIDHPAGSFEPSLAPDGRWFAFVSSRDGDAELYRAALDGGQLQRLTAFHLDDVSPKVSPDGKWIAFVSNREGEDRLFLVRPDGRGVRRLHLDPSRETRWDGGQVEAAEADHAWSPDSRWLLFSARSAGGRWSLFRADVASGQRTRLTEGDFDDQLPDVSPDGRWVAFVSNRTGDPELFCLGPDGGVSQLTRRPGADWKPRWLPRHDEGTGPR